jgi:hypothetical protein
MSASENDRMEGINFLSFLVKQFIQHLWHFRLSFFAFSFHGSQLHGGTDAATGVTGGGGGGDGVTAGVGVLVGIGIDPSFSGCTAVGVTTGGQPGPYCTSCCISLCNNKTPKARVCRSRCT